MCVDYQNSATTTRVIILLGTGWTFHMRACGMNELYDDVERSSRRQSTLFNRHPGPWVLTYLGAWDRRPAWP